MSSLSQALYSEIIAKGMYNKDGNLIEGENGALAHKSAALSNDDLNGLLTEVFLLMNSSDTLTSQCIQCKKVQDSVAPQVIHFGKNRFVISGTNQSTF